ncbi:MAG TPA: squalene/phytoene synthase family protein, partial [Gammaproteobacteria bacterium]|nr:squalene/phytoene synthase family protein [Gammaproteobacteria bacterium]
ILKNHYRNFAEVKDYCHYSANPIGRLLLHLAGQASPENLLLSDALCTGLQLINFTQDIEIDLVQQNRCYIPLDELAAFGVDLADIQQRKTTQQYIALVQKQIARAKELYLRGMQLGDNLPGFFGLEIRFIMVCGYTILERLLHRSDIWQKPVLSKPDMLFLLLKTLCKQPHARSGGEPALGKL